MTPTQAGEAATEPSPPKTKKAKAFTLPTFAHTIGGVFPNGHNWSVYIAKAKPPCGCKGCKGTTGAAEIMCDCITEPLKNCSDKTIEKWLRNKNCFTKQMFLAVRQVVRGAADLYGLKIPVEETAHTKEFLA